jgi:hypothetical protein
LPHHSNVLLKYQSSSLKLEKGSKSGKIVIMIAEELKTKVDMLSADERHELSSYLTKIELESDPDYWKTIRRRVDDDSPDRWVSADDL